MQIALNYNMLHYIFFALDCIHFKCYTASCFVAVFFASFYELYFYSTFSINCDFALKLFEEVKFTFQISMPSLLLFVGLLLAFNISLVFCDPLWA